jgi:hypothetical protein
MRLGKELASLRASSPDNFPALRFIIQSLSMKPVSWQLWESKIKDKIEIYDDGQKLNYKLSYEDNFDLFRFSNLSNIISYSNAIIVAKKNKKIKLWLLGKDNIVRYFEHVNEWKSNHLFSDTPALIFNVVNIFLGDSDKISSLFRMEDSMILTPPFDDIEYRTNNNFLPLWKEMEI